MASIVYDQNKGVIWLLALVDLSAGEPGAPVNTATVEGTIWDAAGTQIWPTPPTKGSFTPLGAGVPVTVGGVTYADGNYKLIFPDTIAWVKDTSGRFVTHRALIETDVGAEFECLLPVETRRCP